MEAVLKSLSVEDVPHILACSASSTSLDYPLPLNSQEAEEYLVQAEFKRQQNEGNEYAAYTTADPPRLFGGGQLLYLDGRCAVAYWVASAFRRQGYGRKLLEILQTEAAREYPDARTIEAYIDPRNVGSWALAASEGYMPIGIIRKADLLVYSKPLRPAE